MFFLLIKALTKYFYSHSLRISMRRQSLVQGVEELEALAAEATLDALTQLSKFESETYFAVSVVASKVPSNSATYNLVRPEDVSKLLARYIAKGYVEVCRLSSVAPPTGDVRDGLKVRMGYRLVRSSHGKT